MVQKVDLIMMPASSDVESHLALFILRGWKRSWMASGTEGPVASSVDGAGGVGKLCCSRQEGYLDHRCYSGYGNLWKPHQVPVSYPHPISALLECDKLCILPDYPTGSQYRC